MSNKKTSDKMFMYKFNFLNTFTYDINQKINGINKEISLQEIYDTKTILETDEDIINRIPSDVIDRAIDYIYDYLLS